MIHLPQETATREGLAPLKQRSRLQVPNTTLQEVEEISRPPREKENELIAEVAQITDLLKENGITYWVDSGTLLGLIREGDFISWDKDVDLSIWAQDLDALSALRPELKRLGYVPWPSYTGPPYVLSLVPRKNRWRNRMKNGGANHTDRSGDGDGMLAVNIGGHFRHEGTAYRLVWDVRKNSYPSNDLRHWLSELYRFPLHVSVFAARSRIGARPLVGRWPWSLIINPGYWAVPEHLLKATTTHPETGLRIPVESEKYLVCRYGDWRIPVKDWDYRRDDAAFHEGVPEFLRGNV